MIQVTRPDRPIKKPLKKIRREFTNRREMETDSYKQQQVEVQENFHCPIPYELIVDMMEFNVKLCREEADFDPFHTKAGQFKFEELDSGKRMVLDMENSSLGKINFPELFKTRTRHPDVSYKEIARLSDGFEDGYCTLMEKYIELVNNPDEKLQKGLQKVNKTAKKAIDFIESRWPFYRITSLADKESMHVLTFTYGEQFLQKLGYSFLEFFLTFADCGQIPNFNPNLAFGAIQLGETVINELFNVIHSQKPHCIARIKGCTMNGIDNKVVNCTLQFFTVFEPKEDGFLFHYYVVPQDIHKIV